MASPHSVYGRLQQDTDLTLDSDLSESTFHCQNNISTCTHDLMQRILAKEIHHVRALADTDTLIPKGSSGYKLFPTPKQAARIDHFCGYLYKLLQNPMSA
jgi:hypothetical protein